MRLEKGSKKKKIVEFSTKGGVGVSDGRFSTKKKKTSPPSAREAAMSAMQQETFLKHLESFLKTSLKHSGNTLENHETPLKNILETSSSMKLS